MVTKERIRYLNESLESNDKFKNWFLLGQLIIRIIRTAKLKYFQPTHPTEYYVYQLKYTILLVEYVKFIIIQ